MLEVFVLWLALVVLLVKFVAVSKSSVKPE